MNRMVSKLVPLHPYILAIFIAAFSRYLLLVIAIIAGGNVNEAINKNYSAYVAWDSAYYLEIAEHGYKYTPGNTESNATTVAFYPLYPVLVRSLSQLTGIDSINAGLVLSNVLFFISIILLVKLLLLLCFDPKSILATIFFLSFYPFSYFLSTVYSESLFLVFSILFFYFLISKRFYAAAAITALAYLTRFNGFFLFIILLIEVVRNRKSLGIYGILSILGISSIGAIVWHGYQFFIFSDPFLNFHIQHAWGYGTFDPIKILDTIRRSFDLRLWRLNSFHTIIIILSVLFTVRIIRQMLRNKPSLPFCLSGYFLLTATFFLFVTAGNNFMSFHRHFLLILPFFLLMGRYFSEKHALLTYFAVPTYIFLFFLYPFYFVIGKAVY